jgi:hypothetical protein
MTTVVVTHEVKNGEHWAKAWHKQPGSRHELLAKLGGTARNFRDPENPNLVGLIFEVPDVQALATFMKSPEVAKAMAEDGVKPETLRMAVEFTP